MNDPMLSAAIRPALPVGLSELTGVLAFLVAADGSLVICNRGMQQFLIGLGISADHARLPSILLKPAFDTLQTALNPPESERIWSGLMHLGNGLTEEQSFHATARWYHGLILLVAEPAYQARDALNRTLTRLTSELTETQRTLVRELQERRQIEEEQARLLAERSKQLAFIRTIADNLAEGLIATDGEGKIHFANPAAELLLGLPSKALIGRYLWDERLLGKDLEADVRWVQSQRANLRRENRLHRRPDGTHFPLGLSMAPLLVDQQVEGVTVVLSDQTALRRAQQAEQLVEVRKQQVEQLRQELQILTQLISGNSTAVSAQLFGSGSLRETLPEVFTQLISAYESVLNLSLEQRAYRVKYDLSEELRHISDRLGFLGAGPRDLIDIHSETLHRLQKTAPHQKIQALLEESRFLVLELMGYLVSYYRRLALSVRRSPPVNPPRSQTPSGTSESPPVDPRQTPREKPDG